MSDSQPFKQFKTTQLARFSGYTLTRLLLLLALSVVISACGDDPAGNGTTDIDNNDGQNGNAVISTTIPLTKDIRSFKQEFYDPLADKCGTCHGAGQSPEFLAGDVNLAYSRAIPFVNLDVVNLDALGNSIFVTKVAGGHNCWDLDLAVCAADITQYITSWVTGSDGVSERDIVLVAPSIRDPGSNRTFPASALDGANSFASTVHVVLKNQCNSCHSETAATPQAPFFANDDPQTSYEAAKSKMNIDFTMDGQSVLADSPLLQSRFIVRLRSEFHNCWTNDCSDDAQDMQDQILLYAQGINIQPIDASLITSKAVNFDDAIIASGGKRHESHTIALWEFAEGSGGIAYDSSGVPDPVNMNLSNTQWLTGNGIEILLGGYAQAYTDDSKKLYNFIKASGEYTLEAWVIPANVTQEESSIISYTGGGSYRNFTMGQTMYNYDFVNLSTDAIGDVVTDGTQDDKLMTNPDDEDLQSSLQHVVMTYAPGVGRKVFVNGQDTGDVDDAGISSGLLNDWSTDFGLYFGREPGNANTQWLGKIRLVAIHNRALTIDQVQQNYEVGVGQRYFLLFSVAERLGAGYEGSFILFEVEQYDNDGYLFNAPKFINLDPDWTPPGAITIKGMRLGLNSSEVVSGQAFGNMNVVVDDGSYLPEGQLLSNLGTVIGVQKGQAADEFFLSFEQLGSQTNPLVEADPVAPASPADPVEPVASDIGVRTFDEINTTMAQITGMPQAVEVDLNSSPYNDSEPSFTTQQQLNYTFSTYRRALPAIPDIEAYLSSHQMAVAQLAMQYCNALVDNDPAFFGDGNTLLGSPGTAAETAFDASNFNTNAANIINPLIEAIMNVDVPNHSMADPTVIERSSIKELSTQPDFVEIRNLLGSDIEQTLDASIADSSYTSLISCMTTCGVNPGGNHCQPYGVDTDDSKKIEGAELACTTQDTNNQLGTNRTKQVAKAVCAATIGSSMMLIK